MARPKSSPSYRLHKPTGLAVVSLSGKDHYLGKHGTPESLERYNALLADWHRRGENLSAPEIKPRRPITIGELAAAYLDHAAKYFRRADQTPTSETTSIKYALRPLLALYVHEPAAEFTPLCLKAVRDEMIRLGWVRTNINRQVNRLRAMFNWGVENELIDGHNLGAVKALKLGRSDAQESDEVKPVPEPMIAAVLPLVAPQVRAMIELQRLTGMRPGEVCTMRTADVQTTGKVWTYTPITHKNAYRGRGYGRTIFIGPRAQEILRPWLRPDLQAWLFSPAEAEAVRLAAVRDARQSRRQPSQVQRMEDARARERRRPPTDCYTVHVYRAAIRKACDRAFALPEQLVLAQRAVSRWHNKWTYDHAGKGPRLADMPAEIRSLRDRVEAHRAAHRWHPHQLRHNAATELANRFGIEAASLVLGHATPDVTRIYAARDLQKAAEIMGQVG